MHYHLPLLLSDILRVFWIFFLPPVSAFPSISAFSLAVMLLPRGAVWNTVATLLLPSLAPTCAVHVVSYPAPLLFWAGKEGAYLSKCKVFCLSLWQIKELAAIASAIDLMICPKKYSKALEGGELPIVCGVKFIKPGLGSASSWCVQCRGSAAFGRGKYALFCWHQRLQSHFVNAIMSERSALASAGAFPYPNNN